MNPISFAVVGGGWRTEFFCRIAAMAPEKFTCVGIYARRDEVARAISQRWGVRTVSSIDELAEAGAEFIISAVSWEAMPSVVTDLVEKGHTVLAETPPAPTADGLRELHDRVGEAKVQVAEQYMYMPGHAARKAVLDRGVLGTPGSSRSPRPTCTTPPP